MQVAQGSSRVKHRRPAFPPPTTSSELRARPSIVIDLHAKSLCILVLQRILTRQRINESPERKQ